MSEKAHLKQFTLLSSQLLGWAALQNASSSGPHTIHSSPPFSVFVQTRHTFYTLRNENFTNSPSRFTFQSQSHTHASIISTLCRKINPPPPSSPRILWLLANGSLQINFDSFALLLCFSLPKETKLRVILVVLERSPSAPFLLLLWRHPNSNPYQNLLGCFVSVIRYQKVLLSNRMLYEYYSFALQLLQVHILSCPPPPLSRIPQLYKNVGTVTNAPL